MLKKHIKLVGPANWPFTICPFGSCTVYKETLLRLDVNPINIKFLGRII